MLAAATPPMVRQAWFAQDWAVDWAALAHAGALPVLRPHRRPPRPRRQQLKIFGIDEWPVVRPWLEAVTTWVEDVRWEFVVDVLVRTITEEAGTEGAAAALEALAALRDEAGGGGGRKCSPAPRARTVNMGKQSRRRRLDAGSLDLFDVDVQALRPRTRGDCIDGPRPCPWVSCQWHLAISIDEERGDREKGTVPIKETYPQLRILRHPDGPGLEALQRAVGSCALDIADELDGTGGVGGLIALNQTALSGKPIGTTSGLTIKETGQRFNLSVERARQLSAKAMQEVRIKLRWEEQASAGRRRR